MNKAVLILGPTGSGKSRLSLELAVAHQLPILNVDSVQMYKGLKIGSALPSSQDLKLAEHHLYAFLEKGSSSTAADYVENVQRLLQQKAMQNRDLLFCGGSGFYLLALSKGMYPVKKAGPELNHEIDLMIEEKGWENIYKWLLHKDPKLQRTVHLNDQYRIRRALEVLLLSQQSPLELEKKLTPSPIERYQKIKVGLFAEKELLRSRVQKRAEEMLDMGFVQEVEELVKKGFKNWPPLQSVGYKEVGLYLSGALKESELLPAIVLANMKLIKKQMTWFKKDSEIKWFHLDKLAQAKSYVSSLLSA